MPYAFFFSYAHENKTQDGVLDKFFSELSTEVAQRLGIPLVEAGFLDRESLRTGIEWTPALTEALQTSSVFVPLISPHYVASTFCGKEYQTFLDRRNRYLQANTGKNPAVILPIIWIKVLNRALPEIISRFQYSDVVVRSLLMASDFSKYRAFLEGFADAIVSGSLLDPALGRLPAISAFSDIENAFAQTNQNRISSASAETGAPSATRVVYVVAPMNEIAQGQLNENAAANSLRTDTTHYGKSGYFWRPFHPALNRVVGEMTFDSVHGYEYKSLDFGLNLVDDLVKADAAGEIVVLVVDPWTIRLPRYQKVMEQFDQLRPLNSGVVIPWNEQDEETRESEKQLRATVRLTFARLYNDPARFRFPIRSADDFAGAIKDILARISMNVNELLAARIALEGHPLATLSTMMGAIHQ